MQFNNTPLKMINRLTVAEQAFEILKQRIICEQYPSGYQLRQDELAKDMGLSRIPLREALLRLQAEGFIDLVAHKGGVVRGLSFAEAIELFELRLLLETDLLAKAIPLISDENLLAAEKALNAFDQLAEDHDKLSNATELNWQFHYWLYEPAGKIETIKILRKLHSNSERYLRKQILQENAFAVAHEQHFQILQHCRNRDSKAAVAELSQHISGVFAQLKGMQADFDS